MTSIRAAPEARRFRQRILAGLPAAERAPDARNDGGRGFKPVGSGLPGLFRASGARIVE